MSTPLGTGVVIPVCTPLNAEGDLDLASLRRLLDHLIENGADGLFVLGTCGEFGFLTDAQRRRVLEATLNHVDGRVPVLVGISETGTARVIDQARMLLPLGADGAVATAPFFAATGPLEIAEHFRRIKDAIGELPLFGYENPPRVNGMSIPADLVVDLAEDGTLFGYKDSSGDEDYLGRILAGRTERHLDDFRVLSGSEVRAEQAVHAGADGLVPGLGNVDPRGYVDLFAAASAGELEAAGIQERLRTMFSIVGIPTHVPMGGSSRALGAFKAALRLLGVIAEDRCAVPSVPFDDDDRAAVGRILRETGMALADQNSRTGAESRLSAADRTVRA